MDLFRGLFGLAATWIDEQVDSEQERRQDKLADEARREKIRLEAELAKSQQQQNLLIAGGVGVVALVGILVWAGRK